MFSLVRRRRVSAATERFPVSAFDDDGGGSARAGPTELRDVGRRKGQRRAGH